VTERRKVLLAKMNALVHEINTTVLVKPTQIELEKIMDVVLQSKKFYVGLITADDKGVLEKPKFIIRGVALARGDTLLFTKLAYRVIIERIFGPYRTLLEENAPVDKIVQARDDITGFYHGEMRRLQAGEVDREQLVMSKKLGQAYSSQTAPMCVYSHYLESKGEPAPVGTKLSFLVVKGQGSVGQRYRPTNTTEPIDYDYYCRLAREPLEKLLNAFATT